MFVMFTKKINYRKTIFKIKAKQKHTCLKPLKMYQQYKTHSTKNKCIDYLNNCLSIVQ